MTNTDEDLPRIVDARAFAEYEKRVMAEALLQIRASSIADIVIWAMFSLGSLFVLVTTGYMIMLAMLIGFEWLMFLALKDRDDAIETQAQGRRAVEVYLQRDDKRRNERLPVTTGHSMS